jgi:hypothetical protein
MLADFSCNLIRLHIKRVLNYKPLGQAASEAQMLTSPGIVVFFQATVPTTFMQWRS